VGLAEFVESVQRKLVVRLSGGGKRGNLRNDTFGCSELWRCSYIGLARHNNQTPILLRLFHARQNRRAQRKQAHEEQDANKHVVRQLHNFSGWRR
jgi:hypothetical protein